MTSILQLGDLHVAAGPRNAQRYAILDRVIAEAEHLRRWGLTIWPGDLGEARLSIEDKNLLAERAQRLATRAPLVLTYGNHDLPGDLDLFGRLHTVYPVCVVSYPRVLPLDLPTGDKVMLFVLPYPTKGALVAAGYAPADVHDAGAAALLDVFREAGAQLQAARNRGELTLMCGHVNVGGSKTSAGQPNIGKELEIGRQHLELLGDIYCGLNHIHLGQEICGAYYPGSMTRLSFGEIEPKRYLTIDIGRDPDEVIVTRRFWLRWLAGALDDPTPVGKPPFEWWHLPAEREDGRLVIHGLIDALDGEQAWEVARRHWPELRPMHASEEADDWRPDPGLFAPQGTPFTVYEHAIDVPPMYHVEGELTREGFTWAAFGVVNGARVLVPAPPTWAGCEVRVRYTFKQSEKAVLHHDAAKAPFAAALTLKTEPVAIPDRALRAPAVAEAKTLADKIRAWGNVVGVQTPQSLLDKLAQLEQNDGPAVIISVQRQLEALVATEETPV